MKEVENKILKMMKIINEDGVCVNKFECAGICK